PDRCALGDLQRVLSGPSGPILAASPRYEGEAGLSRFPGGQVSRRVVGITLDNLEHLPPKCRRCVYWEPAPHVREQAEEFGETALEKEAWRSEERRVGKECSLRRSPHQ